MLSTQWLSKIQHGTVFTGIISRNFPPVCSIIATTVLTKATGANAQKYLQTLLRGHNFYSDVSDPSEYIPTSSGFIWITVMDEYPIAYTFMQLSFDTPFTSSENALNPQREQAAYEALWDRPGMSMKK